jgi:hypothetical protein
MERVYKAPVPIGNFVVRDSPPSENGLFVVDDAGKETRISDPIWHLGNAVRAGVNGASDASDIVEFLDRNGVLQEAIIPHEDLLNHPGKVFEKLARCNFAVPELVPSHRNQPRRNLLISYLAQCRRSPAKKYLLADRMGWHVVDDDWSFVIGSEVISADPSKGLKLSGPISQHLEKFGQHGTLG